MNKNYFYALAVLVGYIIGVGMFGLPFLVSRAGILTFFILLAALSLAQYFLHLIHANVVLSVKEYHRLPGYAQIYLGKYGRIISFFTSLVGGYVALLAYIIITGVFLNQLLAPYLGENEFIYASLMFFIEALIIFFGVGMVARAELLMTGLLLLVVVFIAVKGWGAINLSNYKAMDWRYIFLPYGAMLFALDGGGAIPMVVKILRRQKDKIKSVIRAGTFLPVLVMVVFVIAVVGISGPATTPDALVGIGGILTDGVIFLSLIFGVLTMATSFLGVAEAVKEMLWWDYKINKYLSWALAVFAPYLLYVVGFRDLIGIISLGGALAGGTTAIVLILIFSKLTGRRKKLVLFKYRPGKIIAGLLIGLFALGIIYEIALFFL